MIMFVSVFDRIYLMAGGTFYEVRKLLTDRNFVPTLDPYEEKAQETCLRK